MKHEKGLWIDNNENCWSDSTESEESSVKKSKTLNNCSYCRDCSGCRDCSYCSGCSDCSDCSYCRDCSYCSDCSDCSDCSYCSDCSGCSYCSGCSDCSDCSDCSYCRDCSDCRGCRGCSGYKKNPERIVSPAIGSRDDATTIYWISKDVQVICGCFRGDLSKFKEAIIKTHNKESAHRKNYLFWLDSVQKYIDSVSQLTIQEASK